ncbi:hypothetical protein WH5701_05305 [Synechococcus sp. WH 5701]|nr:hypothetical protein WH5701_05305 [Synechococcus sp. WH 5701]
MDRDDPECAAGADYWEIDQPQWIPMNHLRSLAPLSSAALLGFSLA